MVREVKTKEEIEAATATETTSLTTRAAAAPPADDYSDRFIKYIPSEAVTIYTFLSGVLYQYDPADTRWEW
eukprot:CAMPEP_0194146154 /NCGR_PEP_ID=MMETSP0152-20130528/19983_1 /TAXON_ID=1049557 /ORGANISM="Thalassiothrix antarctica, Strain L6-D1" /LENGTH=70 /DNA_ID=CAMNT_0038846599 /DNA_START=43 /DNA_END=252 /DNA_ORIENTATION=+